MGWNHQLGKSCDCGRSGVSFLPFLRQISLVGTFSTFVGFLLLCSLKEMSPNTKGMKHIDYHGWVSIILMEPSWLIIGVMIARTDYHNSLRKCLILARIQWSWGLFRLGKHVLSPYETIQLGCRSICCSWRMLLRRWSWLGGLCLSAR